MHVVFPHGDEVSGTNDERLQPVIVLEDTSNGSGHECLAQSHHIADEHAVAFIQVMRRYLDRSGLEVEQPVTEHLGNSELGKTGAGLVGEVVGHLQVDVVGRYQRLPRPALFDDLDQLLRNVHTVAIVPPVLEPLLELESGVVVEHVHVQLALAR